VTFDRLFRMASLRLEPPDRGGTPTDPAWIHRRQLPLSDVTLALLRNLSADCHHSQVSAGPLQLAALILEEALLEIESTRPPPARSVSTASPEGGPNA
jgi:hypothetical protein